MQDPEHQNTEAINELLTERHKMITLDPAIYPKYCDYMRLKEDAQKELLGRRSELLKLKHQDGIQNLEEVQGLLDENHAYLVQVGILLDLEWEMPVISEIIKDSDT